MERKKKRIEEFLELTAETTKYYSYADYFVKTPLFTSLRVSNSAADSLTDLTLTVKSDSGLIVETQKQIDEIPFESSVEVEFGDVISPLFFADLNEIKKVSVILELAHEKRTIKCFITEVTVLPFEYWQGAEGNGETLAVFVRPKLGDCGRLKTEMRAQLKKWNVSDDFNGYDGADKNLVRKVVASLFTALRHYSFERDDCDVSVPSPVGGGVKLLSERRAKPMELALLAAATLESAGLNPVIVYGDKQVAVGVWLYSGCFQDICSDDVELLSGYVSDGINNLSCFDADDLFSDKTVAYSTSENHFLQKVQNGDYDKILDIKRARLNRLTPLPTRYKTVKGYEILSEDETSPDEAPKDLAFVKKIFNLEGKLTRDKQWERRLLDLSLKNTLLNFTPKNAVQIISVDSDSAYQAVCSPSPMRITPANLSSLGITDKTPRFGLSKECKGFKELISEDVSGGILRAYEQDEILIDNLARLVKKNKEADEESGGKILYLAFGFLKWYSGGDEEEKYAPLVLCPVTLKLGKGKTYYEISASGDELSVNSTLLEFLKQEFNVDIRGLDGNVQDLKVSEILAMVRMEIAEMKNWSVEDDCFLAAFSFSRYQTWQDLRNNMDEFSKNALVAAMLKNKPLEGEQITADKEDEVPLTEVLTPISADSSQWEAIDLAQKGASFVLHGPPGTGKSQTITNIICNALYSGKRVLFVAEKKAALEVVKKRLDALGVGDFCLELHSSKVNKLEVAAKLASTLALASNEKAVSVDGKAASIDKLKTEMLAPLNALHKKRRLGVSVYEAMLICFKNSDAPDVMNIESVFYDKLTKEKMEKYEDMIRRAAVSVKECGGVHNSPFSNVYLSEYSRSVRDAARVSAEVVITEIKHLKNYLTLFLDLYRQRVTRLTRKKLAAIEEIVKMLSDSTIRAYFDGQKEDEFHAFYNANRRLDAHLALYFRKFKKLVDLKPSERAEISRIINEAGDVEGSKTAASVIKRLEKVAIEPLGADAGVSSLELLVSVTDDMEAIKTNTKLSDKFSSAFGKINYFDGRKKYLENLYRLHDLSASVFADYNADGFNGTCIEAANGYTKPVIDGLLGSILGFRAAEKSFVKAIKADESKLPEEDILEEYSAQAGALIDNVDMLANWCEYRADSAALKKEGLTFVTDALENGSVTADNVIAGFEKNVYRNFLQTTIPLDPALSRFSAAVQEEDSENLRLLLDEYALLCRERIRETLISRLPTPDTEGKCSIELMNFQRYAKTNLRGMGLRKLFEEIPELMKFVAPCMLMSPVTVAQYLRAENGLFDIVVFDEASQMPTAEAIGSLARGKSAVIVGDPKQLPPTSFFNANFTGDETSDYEDTESVLDDCLALGMPEKHLTWHYRSKHESLIAFSNTTYYGGKLCTFPSPDAPDSHVHLSLVENGVYDRGFTKRNKEEARALVADVIRRLKDPVLSRSSIGVVTFSNVQKEYIERKLSAEIAAAKLEEVAYDREEPLFVKNLENVQGDERDVILFSVCYGPDKNGRVSLNFGPLNQTGGWRRLNVAVSRAREEMTVFTSITAAMIDLSKTNSKGVAGLKAFLEFAQKGKTTLAISSDNLKKNEVGIGKYVAEGLSQYGYECRYDVGVSDFKIDVAVLDPKNKHRYVLAVMCDGTERFSVKDRNVLQILTLKRNNWNVTRLYSVNYYNNPKREIKRIKDLLDKITGKDKRSGSGISRVQKPYKYAQLSQKFESTNYVTSGENDSELIARIKAIVAAEEPISEDFLIRRTFASLGIIKSGTKAEGHMRDLIPLCKFSREKLVGAFYYRKTDKAAAYDKCRVENGEKAVRKVENDYSPYEIIALIRAALEDKVALYQDEIFNIVCVVMRVNRATDKFAAYVNDCITLGEEKGFFVRSVSDRISLA